ncbi:hypothetical protein IQ251_03995 [Saccharopolyspora sp. HNM0983]|uniref:Uncharacterized protein n=1 Tax=Saccharopolyspora montiporae TaxID=2781240 RepID=A0A929B7E2_9PSEU|nr:hypothetical protein [Saccharopolyspora sp. HNM0983]MBE9373606.1 hypothetical protein [Saccharopolyspora sp. HNM0983]
MASALFACGAAALPAAAAEPVAPAAQAQQQQPATEATNVSGEINLLARNFSGYANLVDDQGTPIAGEKVEFFTRDGSTFLASGVTSADGGVVISEALPLGLDTVQLLTGVEARFSGGGDYAPSSATGAVTPKV